MRASPRGWVRCCRHSAACSRSPSLSSASGVATGFFLYFRERRRCAALACRTAGSRITLALLIVASLVVGTSIVLDGFPEFTSDLLAHVMNSDAGHIGHDMGGMR